jgi:adenylyltransferase/sulfurtransferase
LEALETIKIALQLEKDCVMSGKLLLFDATTTSFRTVKLRPRDKQCAVCGDTPTIKELIDYEGFCNATATDKVVVPKTLPDKFCISTKDYKTKVIDMKIPHILLDVREPVQYAICALPNSINIPLRELEQRMDELKTKRNENSPQSHALPIYCLCRRGIDSQSAVRLLVSKGLTDVKNIEGGLVSWALDVDQNFPIY